jgi:hypothetical protein
MVSFLIRLVVFVAHKVNVRHIHIYMNKVLINISFAVSDESTSVSHAVNGNNHGERWYKPVLE